VYLFYVSFAGLSLERAGLGLGTAGLGLVTADLDYNTAYFNLEIYSSSRQYHT